MIRHPGINSCPILYNHDSRGFAFVEMESRDAAEAAIQALNEAEWDGRSPTVNEARTKEDRGNRSSFSGGRGNQGGGRSRGGFRPVLFNRAI